LERASFFHDRGSFGERRGLHAQHEVLRLHPVLEHSLEYGQFFLGRKGRPLSRVPKQDETVGTPGGQIAQMGIQAIGIGAEIALQWRQSVYPDTPQRRSRGKFHDKVKTGYLRRFLTQSLTGDNV
jgi:hypothetical protein